MADRMTKLIHKIGGSLSAWMLIAMTVIIFAQVVFRFVIKGSLPWSEEAARYLMVWATFIGAGLAALEKGHIGVSFFINLFGKSREKLFGIINMLVLSITFAILIFFSCKLIIFIMATGQVSPSMELPMWIPYTAVPVGLLVTFICFWLAFVKEWNDGGDR